jgi:streptolysin S family bacteriocin protoxin
MFKELADDLLDLTATAQRYRKPFLANMQPGMLCCCCTCCCCDVYA